MPDHITCSIIREYTVIRSTAELNSVDVFDNRINFIKFNVENSIIDNIGAVDENKFHSVLFGDIHYWIVKLLRNKLPISTLYKNDHK